MTTPTITISVDKKCPTCGRKGAVVRADGGLNPCLKCVADRLKEETMAIKPSVTDWYRHKAAEALLPPLRKSHPHLDAALIVVLSGPLPKAGEGCKVLGRARRPKKTEVALLEAMGVTSPPHYVIEVDTLTWDTLSQTQRLALLDHELCHMAGRQVDDDGELGPWELRGHDVEEFTPIVQRHGAWRPALQDMAKVMQQLDLPGMQ